MQLQAHFTPDESKLFTTTLTATAEVDEDPMQRVDAPLTAVSQPMMGKPGTSAVRLTGHGKRPDLRLDPPVIDLGPSQAFTTYTHLVRPLKQRELPFFALRTSCAQSKVSVYFLVISFFIKAVDKNELYAVWGDPP